MTRNILVTGGAGFIGSAVVRHIILNTQDSVVTVDKLTYAGNMESLATVSQNPRHAFEQVDICDVKALENVFRRHRIDLVMHLAAESHVDRSIDSPGEFIQTNVVGTFTLLNVAMRYFEKLPHDRADAFRFHHISTDEVFGDLGDTAEALFKEDTAYAPSSPIQPARRPPITLFVLGIVHTGFLQS